MTEDSMEGNGQVVAKDPQRERLLQTLAELGGQQVRDDEVNFEGSKFVVPTQYRGRLGKAAKFLRDLDESLNTEHRFRRVFKYRPFDGAHALEQVVRNITGAGGLGKATFSFFSGKTPPQKVSVPVSPTETVTVPWGAIELPIFEGVMHTGAQKDPELGVLFEVIIDAPKRYEASIEGLFEAIEQYLREHSIYRGKAIDAKQDKPNFVDVSSVDPSRIVYSEDLQADLDSLIWRFVRDRETLVAQGIPFKRAVVLFGKYGTGKTETANLTAKECVDNGVTFIKVRAGKDSLDEAMQTARLLQPSVVFFEDVDTVAEAGGDQQAITRLLDLFDGMDAKHNDVMVVLTTNHIDRIHKGMMRPGRIDAAIEIGLLDADGIRRLAENRLGADNLAPDLDWVSVYAACENYSPAFVNEALKRVYLYHRGDGVYTTQDLVRAAEGLRSQYELMEDAVDTVGNDRFETILNEVVERAVNGVPLEHEGNETGHALGSKQR